MEFNGEPEFACEAVHNGSEGTSPVSADESNMPSVSDVSPIHDEPSPIDAVSSPPSNCALTSSSSKGQAKKGKGTSSAKRPRDENAEAHAAHRHSQRLLRKAASTIDLKSVIAQSFTSRSAPCASVENSQCEHSLRTPSSSSLSAFPAGPRVQSSLASPNSINMTDMFLKKVNDKKNDAVDLLIRRELSTAVAFATDKSFNNTTGNGNNAKSNTIQLVLDIESVQQEAAEKSQRPFKNPLVSPIVDESNPSSTSISPLTKEALLLMDERSRSNTKHPLNIAGGSATHQVTTSANNVRDEESHIVDDSMLINSIARKHTIAKFKKEQLMKMTQSQDEVGGTSSPLTTTVPAAKKEAAPVARLPAANSAMIRQRNLTNITNAFANVSTSDMSFLKRTNSFDNSHTQSIVFNATERK